MTHGSATLDRLADVPSWVPEPARHYLAHTESGTSIRALARRAGCHASTVLRQIRSYESRRDDLLVDEGLRRLGRLVLHRASTGSQLEESRQTMHPMTKDESHGAALTEAQLATQSRRILLRLCETGAVLAVAAEMDKAVVVRETADGGSSRTAVVDRAVAEAMALKSWITCDTPGRILRYRITATGRAAVNRMLAEEENRAVGFAEAQAAFDAPLAVGTPGLAGTAGHPARRVRYGAAETPLAALARRKDRDGRRFLSDDLVRVGERLREDFELCQIKAAAQRGNWDHVLGALDDAGRTGPDDRRTTAARARVAGALRDLGPGLGDMALRCCCYLEGLEKAEKRMGWSARSGKIVLRIALQRLKQHYESLGDAGGLIG